MNNCIIIGIIILIIIIGLIIYKISLGSWSITNEILPTVINVDLSKYQGTWYESFRLPNFFQKGCSDSTANYTLNPDNTMAVVNTCLRDNKINKITGTAYPDGTTFIPNTTILKKGDLKVYFRPFYGEYKIIDLTTDYRNAMVGTSNRKYLWILSKDKNMDLIIKDQMMDRARSLGFKI